MKTLIIALLALTVGSAALLPEVAEAKRFGGGKSLGQQYSAPRQAPPRQNPQRQAQPAQQPGQQGAAAQGANRSGASRWLGPLAGLAAGGLLAAMLFGDGFQGFQVLDFVIIALLLFGGFLLVRTLRRRAAKHGPLPAGAVAGPGGAVAGAYARTGGGGRATAFDPVAAAAPAGMDATGADEAPAWFDAGGFVEGARAHFIRLQAAWDQNQMDEIASYTAPALFEELRLERARLDGAENSTEVVRLAADLLGVRRDGDQVVASVRFTGLIREDAAAPAVAMDETWHVAHAWDSPAGDWRIVGIQQNGA